MAKGGTKATSEKLGRNSDGTFKEGNKESVGNNGGRPKEPFSFRERAKIMAQKDPSLVKGVIDNLIKIASDPDHPKCTDAADKLIKLIGNYDPSESKTELSGKVEGSPFSNLSQKEVEALLKKYDKR